MSHPYCLVELSRVLKRSCGLDALARMGFGTMPAAAAAAAIPVEVFKSPSSLPEPPAQGGKEQC